MVTKKEAKIIRTFVSSWCLHNCVDKKNKTDETLKILNYMERFINEWNFSAND